MYAGAVPRGFYPPEQHQACPPFIAMQPPQNWVAQQDTLMSTTPQIVGLMVPQSATTPYHPYFPGFMGEQGLVHNTGGHDGIQSSHYLEVQSAEQSSVKPIQSHSQSTSILPLKKRDVPKLGRIESTGSTVTSTEPFAAAAVRTYPCPTCGKEFTNSSNRVRHKRLHTGEKP